MILYSFSESGESMWGVLFAWLLFVYAATNIQAMPLLYQHQRTPSLPGNGIVVLELTYGGGVAVDISDWSGPSLQISRLADEHISFVSSNNDIALAYTQTNGNTVMVLLYTNQKKYICETGPTMEAYMTLSTVSGVFFVLDATHCTEHVIHPLDNELLQHAWNLVIY